MMQIMSDVMSHKYPERYEKRERIFSRNDRSYSDESDNQL